MMRLRKLALALGFILFAGHALAVQPSEVLPDPALEARARSLSAELRCLVCQNQSIDDSDADLARDIRVLIRERIAKGESNDSVRAFLVSRYGDFILLQPPFKSRTLLLWLSAPLTLLIGGFFVLRASRRAKTEPPLLNPEEEAQLAKIERADKVG
jgi:cytochrome c-type biogenesis protein CcmH